MKQTVELKTHSPKLISRLLNYFFPKQCINCGVFGGYLCQLCTPRYLIPSLDQKCHVCKESIEGGFVHKTCKEKTYLDGVIVCYSYNKVVEKLIAEFKYSFYTNIGSFLAEHMSMRLSFLGFGSAVGLVPVPLHQRKLKARGFNQAELLAKTIAKSTGLKYLNLLVRSRNTKTQVGMSRGERMQNLKDVFELSFSNSKTYNIKHKMLFLVDDVMTTGTTLEECAKVLKAKGAQRVYAIVFARG